MGPRTTESFMAIQIHPDVLDEYEGLNEDGSTCRMGNIVIFFVRTCTHSKEYR